MPDEREFRKPAVVMPEMTEIQMIREITNLQNQIAILEKNDKRDPEDKEYLFLVCFTDGVRSYEIVQGRTAAREYIINNIEQLDIHETKMLVDGTPISGRKSVYEFMKYIEQFYDENLFDIEDYNVE